MLLGCFLRRALFLSLAIGLALPALAETEQERKERLEREQRAREQSLFGHIGKVTNAQTDITRNASLGNRNASTVARGLGRNSIARGIRHIRHGRSTMNRPEVRLGYFEVVQGILGLVASATAARLSDISGSRAEGLQSQGGVANGAGGTGAPGGHNAASVSGASGASSAHSSESWKTTMADLSTDDAKSAFAEIEEEYGITRKELLDELKAGRDGAELLENAKKNAEAREEVLAALKEAREKAAREAAAAAATEGAGGGGRSLASLSAPLPEPPSSSADAAAPVAAAKPKGNFRDDLRRRLGEMPDELDAEELSPEVRAALAAREAAQAEALRREAKIHATIFDMVRAKYAEREGMIRGWIRSPGAGERAD